MVVDWIIKANDTMNGSIANYFYPSPLCFPHLPLLCFLLTATHFAVIFILVLHRFGAGEASQAMGNTCVLFDIHRQVKEVLIFRANAFTIQTARFVG